MKKIIYSVLATGMLFVAGACVDDYTDSNPPHKLDAPTLRLAETGTSVSLKVDGSNPYQYGYRTYGAYSEPAIFEVTVLDAPGKIDAASVSFSIPEYGTATLDEASFNAIKGKETGTFKVIFTPNPNLPDEEDRTGNFVVTVTDSQLDDKGVSEPLSTTLTFPVVVVPCISRGIEGKYKVTAAEGNVDGGDAYTLTDLTDILEGDVEVTISANQPGRFTISDATGGVWPAFYEGRAAAVVQVDYCGGSFTGHPGSLTAGSDPGPFRTFTIDGEVGAGTITVTWSYVRDDAPTPADPAQGTYTLTKIN
jgi:hypothetical protein